MVRGGDGTAAALRLADRQVLVECRGPLDGWLIDSGSFIDVIGRSIAHHGALVGSAGKAGIIFHDVIFDERIGGPAIDRQLDSA